MTTEDFLLCFGIEMEGIYSERLYYSGSDWTGRIDSFTLCEADSMSLRDFSINIKLDLIVDWCLATILSKSSI